MPNENQGVSAEQVKLKASIQMFKLHFLQFLQQSLSPILSAPCQRNGCLDDCLWRGLCRQAVLPLINRLVFQGNASGVTDVAIRML